MLPPAQQQWFEAWLQHQQMMAQANQQQMQQMQAWQTPAGQGVVNPLLGRLPVPALAQGAPQNAVMQQMMAGAPAQGQPAPVQPQGYQINQGGGQG